MQVFSGHHQYPSYYSSPHHHQASLYPNLYSASTYSLPAVGDHSHYSTAYQHSPYNMPTYYVQSPGSHRSHHDSHRSRRSSSHHRSGTGYAQPVVYTSSNATHHRDYAYATPSRHHRSASVGYRDGGNYYHTPSYSSRDHKGSYGHSSGQYYYPTTTSTHRSHSTSRHYTPQVVDARHGYSTSGRDRHHGTSYVSGNISRATMGHSPEHATSQADAGYHGSGQRYYYDTHEDFGDRVRRWFGLSPGGHRRSHSTSRQAEYVDARTGRSVSRSGRPVYRV